MNIKPMIWTYKPRKNGECNIKIYVSFEGVKKYYKTPYYCQPTEFNKKTGKVKRNHPNHSKLNGALYEICQDIESHLIKTGSLKGVGETKKESLIKFLDAYIQDIADGKTSLRPSSGKNYRSLQTRLKQYMKHKGFEDIAFDDVTIEFYNDFKRFLFDFCNCGLPGFSKHVKIIKTVLRLAEDQNLHSNQVYKSRVFKRHRKKISDKTFLTVDDIKKLEKLDLSHDPGLDHERDRFLISYYFLMRFEDSRRIQEGNVIPGKKPGQRLMKYTQQKTGSYCIVPVSPAAEKILKKRNYDLSGGSNPQSNRNIKTVCALAGINQDVSEGEKVGPKWKFVTTHTARRSAATNLALQNVSIKIIADLGGWADIDTLRTYLRASGLDTAHVAQDLDFFS